MYRLSLAGVVFAVGFALWFRPVLGLAVVHRYRGPPSTSGQFRVRERTVVCVAAGCIVLATAVATLLFLP